MLQISTDSQAPLELGSIDEMNASHTPPDTDTPYSTTSTNDTDADTSTDTSTNATPVRSGTPTGTVLIPGRKRSGTIVARTIWDEPNPLTDTTIVQEVHSKLLQLDPQIPLPGAPRAIDDAGGLRRDGILTDRRNRVAPDVTPRARPIDLPMTNTPTPRSRMRWSQGDISTNQTPTTTRGGKREPGTGMGRMRPLI